MLLRPPSINDEQDNLSHVISESDARQSSRSRNKIKKKENSLSFRNKPLNSSRENEEQDKEENRSVHSHASGRSKKSKKKQSSLAINKRGGLITANSPRKSQEEELEVLDYEQDTQRHKNQNRLYSVEHSEVKKEYAQPAYAYSYSPDPNENQSPGPQKHNYNNITTKTQREDIDEEIPVVKLVETKTNNKMGDGTRNMVSPKMAQRTETRKLGQLFEENRKNVQNSSQLGLSNVPSQINNSSLGGESRRSRSKLGQLFKEKSRQKQMNNSSRISEMQTAQQNNKSTMSDLQLNLQPNIKRDNKNVQIHGIGHRSKQKMVNIRNNIPEKVLEESVQQFSVDQNRSQLNLSVSRNSPMVSKLQYPNSDLNNKDSVCFNIEPERERRKKGLGLASKMAKQQDEMIKISGNLASKQIQPIRAPPNPKSNQQEAHAKLKMNLKQNQKYLIESGILENNQKKIIEQREREEEQRIKRQQERKIEDSKRRQIERQTQRQKEIQNQRAQRMEIQRQKEQREKQRLKQKKAQQQKLKRLEAQTQRQIQLKYQKERQKEQAIKQKERLKKAYQREQEIIRKEHEAAQKQKSLVYQLENQSFSKPEPEHKNLFKNLEHLPSTFSRQSSKQSVKSKDSRKSTRKKEGIIPKNSKKHLLGEASPRAEESFYEQSQSEAKGKTIAQVEQKPQLEKVPRKLMSFNQSDDLSYEPKNQYKTDTYFYDKSSKYSKPPLSRKSNSSKSKPKQGTISKKPKESQVKINQGSQSRGAEKKLSLVELAMRKNYEPQSGSQYQSQDSFRSRDQSGRSSGSRNSINSRGSKKKQSVIKLKENTFSNYNRPPLYRKNSSQNQDSLANRTSRHEKQMSSRQKFAQIVEKSQRPTIISGCSFIDERGRLVENGNMIVKGSQVTGSIARNNGGLTEQRFIQKLMNSREKRRSRSKERTLNRSRNSSRSIQKNDSRYDSRGQYVQSEAYSETQSQGRRFESSGSNFYDTRKDQYSNGPRNSGQKLGTHNLQQFIKPIQSAEIAQQRQQTSNKQTIYYGNEGQAKKRSMQRTEKSKGY